jgi:hypothetical protein
MPPVRPEWGRVYSQGFFESDIEEAILIFINLHFNGWSLRNGKNHTQGVI